MRLRFYCRHPAPVVHLIAEGPQGSYGARGLAAQDSVVVHMCPLRLLHRAAPLLHRARFGVSLHPFKIVHVGGAPARPAGQERPAPADIVDDSLLVSWRRLECCGALHCCCL